MKNLRFLLFLLLSGAVFIPVKGQTTVVLQPGAATGQDASVFSCVPCGYSNRNFGTQDAISAVSWTYSGNVSDTRTFLQFDLSSIPANAIIQNARLSLFANPARSHSSQSGPNNTLLQRVTGPWNEATITWNNQPSTTTQNQLAIPATSTPWQDFTNLNVTAMVQDMLLTGQHYGFMLRLATESHYRSVELTSSDHTNQNLWPKMEITYVLPTGIAENKNQTFRLYPNPASGAATLKFDNPDQKPHTLEIFNLVGNAVFRLANVRNEKADLNLKDLPAGIYYYRLRYLQKVKATGKLMVK